MWSAAYRQQSSHGGSRKNALDVSEMDSREREIPDDSPEKGELLDAILGVYRADQVARVSQTTRQPQDQPPVVAIAFFRYGEETPVFVGEMEFEMVGWLAKRLQMVVES